MRVLVGAQNCGKSTVLLHYVYNEIHKVLRQEPEASETKEPHVCLITSKKHLMSSNLIFGIYCEVSIETLKQVKLKYIEDYDDLVKYLCDFHLMPDKPSLLAIDGLDKYFEQKTLSATSKLLRLNFILTLVRQCQAYLDPTNIFAQNNTIVSYRVDSAAELTGLSDTFARFSKSLLYLSRNEVSAQLDSELLEPEAQD